MDGFSFVSLFFRGVKPRHADCYTLSANSEIRRHKNMDDAIKIYGLCLERLKHHIKNAKNRVKAGTYSSPDQLLLESYNAGDLEDIVDILELLRPGGEDIQVSQGRPR